MAFLDTEIANAVVVEWSRLRPNSTVSPCGWGLVADDDDDTTTCYRT